MAEQKTPSLPSYDKVSHLLNKMNIETNAAEIHGSLCGLLSSGDFDKATEYVQDLIEHVDIKACELELKQLVSLVDITLHQLKSVSFDLHLLLPEDEEPLDVRAKALSLWCQGYSDALLNLEINIEAIESEEARDAFFHITEFASIDYNYTVVTEEDEKAYAEVYEYVRMAVLMIYTEINEGRDGSKLHTNNSENRTLH